MTKNDVSWNLLFNHLSILGAVQANGHFDISADQINQISGRQARLMAKFDSYSHLPSIMKLNALAMLAIEDGLYRIGKFNPFITIQPMSLVPPAHVSFPKNIISINPNKLSGESEVLDASLLAGILDRVFGEKVNITIRGRSAGYSSFSFSIGSIKFPIKGVQIEVDGGYEGLKTINLVEAKSFAVQDISIRQVLYPQLAWELEVNNKKLIRSFVCLYEAPFIRFIPIVCSNSGCVADHSRESVFIIARAANLNIKSIVANPSAALPLVSAPFPQANRFNTALEMFKAAAKSAENGMEIKKEDLITDFDIEPDVRHTDYYANILRWLGLITIKRGFVFITEFGLEISLMSHHEQIEKLATIIFSEPLFNYVLHHGSENIPDSLFARWRITGSTKPRRISTVKAWIKYFEDYAILTEQS